MEENFSKASTTDIESRAHREPKDVTFILQYQRSGSWFEDLNKTTAKLFSALSIND
jgi:hypothetical protein